MLRRLGGLCAKDSSLPKCLSTLSLQSRGFASFIEEEPAILKHDLGACGLAILNRPKLLNALDLDMVEDLKETFSRWDDFDNPIKVIVLKGSGHKSFCAGGNVKLQYDNLKEGKKEEFWRFFYANYQLNYVVGTLRKPFVAVIDGITAGGGAGLSMNAKFNVSTERTLWAMPEVKIGYFPDCGASLYFNRMKPGIAWGRMMALSGTFLRDLQVKDVGICTHYLRSEKVPQIGKDLEKVGMNLSAKDSHISAEDEVDMLLGGVEVKDQWFDASQQNPDGIYPILKKFTNQYLHDIESMEHLMDVLEMIQSKGARVLGLEGFSEDYSSAIAREFASSALKEMNESSPLSLKIAFEAHKRARKKNLKDTLIMEYRITRNFAEVPNDFLEGVRAKLIDRDDNPKWMHKTVQEVPDSLVRDFFRGFKRNDLYLDEIDDRVAKDRKKEKSYRLRHNDQTGTSRMRAPMRKLMDRMEKAGSIGGMFNEGEKGLKSAQAWNRIHEGTMQVGDLPSDDDDDDSRGGPTYGNARRRSMRDSSSSDEDDESLESQDGDDVSNPEDDVIKGGDIGDDGVDDGDDSERMETIALKDDDVNVVGSDRGGLEGGDNDNVEKDVSEGKV